MAHDKGLPQAPHINHSVANSILPHIQHAAAGVQLASCIMRSLA
jgi:hypothetical protein